MSDPIAPEWFHRVPHAYYTYIERNSPSVVSVRRAPSDQEVCDENPGTLVLRLQSRRRTTHIVDADGLDCGGIRPEGVFPGLRFVMRRNGAAVWVLSVRSFVRKRHRLQTARGDIWTFDTPFFWWQHLTGTVNGHERLVGGVGPTTWQWGFMVEPGGDTPDLLAAVAFMHWKWWHW